MGLKIHPSVLCADSGNLQKEVETLNTSGADSFHMDVMDGSFVPNFGLGADIFNCVKKHGKLPVFTHLMINEPARYVEYFRELGSDTIVVHPEADRQCAATLARIKTVGAIPGIAINPGTSVETVKELLPLCGMVLVMTVNPGFYGQEFLEFTVEKIKTLCELRRTFGYSLCVDGNINAERAKRLSEYGVTDFVIGTALFVGEPSALIREIT